MRGFEPLTATPATRRAVRRRRWLIAGGAVVVIAAFLYLTVGTASPGAHTGSVDAYLVAAPAGASSCASGPGTVVSADTLFGPSVDGQPLSSYRLTGTAQRCWITSDGSRVQVAIARFAMETDATQAYADLVNPTLTPDGGTRRDDADAVMFTEPTIEGLATARAYGHRGDVVFLVITTREASANTTLTDAVLRQVRDGL